MSLSRRSRSEVVLHAVIAMAIAGMLAWIVYKRVEAGERENRRHIVRMNVGRDQTHRVNLNLAIERGDTAAFKRLLGRPSPTDYDVLYSLCVASNKGRCDIVKLLLDLGCDPRSGYAENALESAARDGYTDIVELLLSRHARPDPSLVHPQSSALGWAAANDHSRAVALLLSAGADVNGQVEQPKPIPLTRFAHGHGGAGGEAATVAAFANRRYTPLMLAAASGSEQTVRLLLGAHADVNLRSGSGKTALGYAKSFNHKAIVRMLQLAGGIE